MYLLADLIVILVFLIGSAVLGFLLGKRIAGKQANRWRTKLQEQQQLVTDAQSQLKRAVARRAAVEHELTEVRAHLSGQGVNVADLERAAPSPQEVVSTSAKVTSGPARQVRTKPTEHRSNGRAPEVSRTTASSRSTASQPSKQDETLARIRHRARKLDLSRIGTADPGQRDDLKQIAGIGIFAEKKLNALSIYTFAQIARFSEGDQRIINRAIELSSDRIAQDGWVAQAKRFTDS